MFTKTLIDSFRFEGKTPSTPDIRWDKTLPGFGVRIQPSGRKSFVLRYTLNGKRHPPRTIGQYGVFTLDQARKLVLSYLQQIALGVDPFEKPVEVTVGELAKTYVELHASRKKSGRNDVAMIEQFLKPLFHLPLKDLTAERVTRLHKAIGEESPYRANRFLALVSTMWNKAAQWEKLPPNAPNPTRWVKKYEEKSRDRFVTKEEMPRLLKAIDEDESEQAKAALWLYLLTGFRKSELLSLRWDQVDLKAPQITLTETKSGKTLYLPIPVAAVEVLKGIRRQVSPFVFPSPTVPGAPLEDIRKAWERIRKRARLQDVRLHDLRRTVGSWLATGGASLPLIGKVLNHSNEKTTAIYARFDQEPVRQALNAYADMVVSARGGRPKPL